MSPCMKVPWETGIQVLWVTMLMENVGMVENIRNGGMVDGLVLQVVQLLVDRAGTGRRGPLYRYTGSFFYEFL